MTINVKLSTESIDRAIAKLIEYQEEFDSGVEKVVELLTNEGADVANGAYGDWGVEAVPIPEGMSASIMVVGDMPLIAEFGAGDATLNPKDFFSRSPGTPVFPGSYSMRHAMMYSTFGEWKFAGRWMSEVQPRQGLYSAKMYIIENSTEIAQGVFK